VLPVKYQFLSHVFIASMSCHCLSRVRSEQKHCCHIWSYCCIALPQFWYGTY